MDLSPIVSAEVEVGGAWKLVKSPKLSFLVFAEALELDGVSEVCWRSWSRVLKALYLSSGGGL